MKMALLVLTIQNNPISHSVIFIPITIIKYLFSQINCSHLQAEASLGTREAS